MVVLRKIVGWLERYLVEQPYERVACKGCLVLQHAQVFVSQAGAVAYHEAAATVVYVLETAQTACATQHQCSVDIVHGIPCLVPYCAYHLFGISYGQFEIIFSANSKSSG